MKAKKKNIQNKNKKILIAKLKKSKFPIVLLNRLNCDKYILKQKIECTSTKVDKNKIKSINKKLVVPINNSEQLKLNVNNKFQNLSEIVAPLFDTPIKTFQDPIKIQTPKNIDNKCYNNQNTLNVNSGFIQKSPCKKENFSSIDHEDSDELFELKVSEDEDDNNNSTKISCNITKFTTSMFFKNDEKDGLHMIEKSNLKNSDDFFPSGKTDSINTLDFPFLNTTVYIPNTMKNYNRNYYIRKIIINVNEKISVKTQYSLKKNKGGPRLSKKIISKFRRVKMKSNLKVAYEKKRQNNHRFFRQRLRNNDLKKNKHLTQLKKYSSYSGNNDGNENESKKEDISKKFVSEKVVEAEEIISEPMDKKELQTKDDKILNKCQKDIVESKETTNLDHPSILLPDALPQTPKILEKSKPKILSITENFQDVSRYIKHRLKRSEQEENKAFKKLKSSDISSTQSGQSEVATAGKKKLSISDKCIDLDTDLPRPNEEQPISILMETFENTDVPELHQFKTLDSEDNLSALEKCVVLDTNNEKLEYEQVPSFLTNSPVINIQPDKSQNKILIPIEESFLPIIDDFEVQKLDEDQVKTVFTKKSENIEWPVQISVAEEKLTVVSDEDVNFNKDTQELDEDQVKTVFIAKTSKTTDKVICANCKQILDMISQIKISEVRGISLVKCPYCWDHNYPFAELEFHLIKEHNFNCEDLRLCNYAGFKNINMFRKEKIDTRKFLKLSLMCRCCCDTHHSVASLNEHVIKRHYTLLREPLSTVTNLGFALGLPKSCKISKPSVDCTDKCVCKRYTKLETMTMYQKKILMKECPNAIKKFETLQLSGIEVHICILCETTFLAKDRAVDHMINEHAPAAYFSCYTCLTSFKNPQMLNKHQCVIEIIEDHDKIVKVGIMPNCTSSEIMGNSRPIINIALDKEASWDEMIVRQVPQVSLWRICIKCHRKFNLLNSFFLHIINCHIFNNEEGEIVKNKTYDLLQKWKMSKDATLGEKTAEFSEFLKVELPGKYSESWQKILLTPDEESESLSSNENDDQEQNLKETTTQCRKCKANVKRPRDSNSLNNFTCENCKINNLKENQPSTEGESFNHDTSSKIFETSKNLNVKNCKKIKKKSNICNLKTNQCSSKNGKSSDSRFDIFDSDFGSDSDAEYYGPPKKRTSFKRDETSKNTVALDIKKNKKKSYECEFCSKIYATKKWYRKHVYTHYSSDFKMVDEETKNKDENKCNKSEKLNIEGTENLNLLPQGVMILDVLNNTQNHNPKSPFSSDLDDYFNFFNEPNQGGASNLIVENKKVEMNNTEENKLKLPVSSDFDEFLNFVEEPDQGKINKLIEENLEFDFLSLLDQPVDGLGFDENSEIQNIIEVQLLSSAAENNQI